MIELDGSEGEGGGQILRTSLALSLVTGQPFRIRRIRAGRSKPGLLRQHLTGVRAAAEIGGAEATGAELGSTELVFQPGKVAPGAYSFAVGSAGSANLVLQTILLPLVLAGESVVELEGGTHNPASPPHGFLDGVFLPLLARMGAPVELTLERWGFYPAGGGRMVAGVPSGAVLRPLELHERGEVRSIAVSAAVAGGLPASIGQRELQVASRILGVAARDGRVIEADSPGPGNAVWITVACDHATEVFTGFGERGRRAEDVAESCAREAKAWIDSGVPVGEHTADQLLLPLALAGGGSFTTAEPSLHTRTNAAIIERFLPVRFTIAEHGPTWRIGVERSA